MSIQPGRVALVTGASRGIGRAIALRLAREGARVAVNYRARRAEAEAVVELMGGGLALQADVADAAQVDAMLARIERQMGPVDILVNNAGRLARGDLADFDWQQMPPMRATNVDGLVFVTRAAARGMKERGWGRIVNLSSIAAHGTAMAGTTFYAATKAAVSLLTRRFAMDLGPHGVTVNAVAPGFILTDMVSDQRKPEEIAELVARMSRRAMLRRVGQPEDIAHAVAFLASEEAGFLTAQVLTIDGGRMDYLSHP
ncbi:MAG: 3-oxoacyl-ACP reductase FabG [Acidobacteria bacterium]|nr:3-oxoacyl-ACP reductase FabG [Acidobacteriota bacterium]MBI3281589.1 3-oxoacyl-ACP reductase FabG [Acidobacteriota bacterium]